MKESILWLYRFMPLDTTVSWNVNIIGKTRDTLKNACWEMMMVIKILSENKNATSKLYEISALFSPSRQRLMLSAGNTHTFTIEVNKRYQIVKFKRDQSDILPAVDIVTLKKESDTTRPLLVADLVVEITTFALNVCGYSTGPLSTVSRIRKKLSKVKELLQSKDLISFFENILGNAKSSSEDSRVKLVFNVLRILHKEGVLVEIICELVDVAGWLDIFKVFAKVTVFIIANTELPSKFSYASYFLKGSELINKIDTYMQLFVNDLKSKL